MPRRARLTVPALAAVLTVSALIAPVPAHAAGKTVHVTKSDSAGNAVAGASFTLFKDAAPVGGGPPKGAEDTVAAGTCTTGANGQCDITDVAPGDYWLSETGPPAGYVAAADSTLKVTKGKKKVFEVVVVDDRKALKVRVNDPTDDAAFDDGTHIFQFGPSVAVAPCGRPGRPGGAPGDECPIVMSVFNDSTGFYDGGDVSGVGVAISYDGGTDWTDVGELPTPTEPLTFVLGQPSVTWDDSTSRFLVAASVITNIDGNVVEPGLIWRFDPAGRRWFGPTDASTFFNSGSVDHGLRFGSGYRDAPVTSETFYSGRQVLSFTRSEEDSTSQVMTSRSTNGGLDWSRPISVSGVGHYDFASVVSKGPNAYISWSGFTPGASEYDIWYATSGDGGRTWSNPSLVAGGIPESGSIGALGSTRTILGGLIPFNAPSIAIDPTNAQDVYVVYPEHGAGADEADVTFRYSTNGGQTWSDGAPVEPVEGTQFSPTIGITPDGRAVFEMYSGVPGAVGLTITSTDVFGRGDLLGRVHSSTTVDPVTGLGDVLTPYDSGYGAGSGWQGIGLFAWQRGFATAWTAGDLGPAANAGVDPNIAFVNLDPSLATTMGVKAHLRHGILTIGGDVEPQPVPPARVTIEVLGEDLRVRTDRRGRFETHIDLPVMTRAFHAARGCLVTVTFRGSIGRLPSGATDRFC